MKMKKILAMALMATFACSLPALAKINAYVDKDIDAVMYSADKKITYWDNVTTLDFTKTIAADNSELYKVTARFVGMDFEKKYVQDRCDLLIDGKTYALNKIKFHSPYGVKPVSNEISAEFDIPVSVAKNITNFKNVLAFTFFFENEKPRSFTFGKDEEKEIRLITTLDRKSYAAVASGKIKVKSEKSDEE